MIKQGVTFSKDGGIGNTSVTISADTNEGLDDVIPFRVTDSTGSYKDVAINREGRREVFNDFVLSDGGTFNVIKDGLQ